MPNWRPRVLSPNKLSSAESNAGISSKKDDGFIATVVNYVPIEVIAVFEIIAGLIPTADTKYTFWIAVALVPVTALWIVFGTTDEASAEKIAWRQACLAPFAFGCWAMATQLLMMQAVFTGWKPWIGSVAAAAGSLLLPILNGILRACGVPQDPRPQTGDGGKG